MKKFKLNLVVILELVLVVIAQQQLPNFNSTDFLRNNISGDSNNSSLKFIQKKFSSNENLVVKNFDNLTRIDDVLNLFSIDELGRQWVKVSSRLSSICAHNMLEYFNGLENRKIWAVKMDDATGHYTSGFFWGNNYFMGSMSLCKTIYKTEHDDKRIRKNPQNVGLSFINGNVGIAQVEVENPPFVPRFYVLRFLVNETQSSPNFRTVFIGACLPSSCTEDDLSVMSDFGPSALETRSSAVTGIRVPGGDGYRLANDGIFITMLIVTLVVCVFLAWGTALDIVLKRRLKRKMQMKKYSKDCSSESSGSGLNCTTYDLTRVIADKKNCVGIGIPTGVNNNNSDENLAIDLVDDEKTSVWTELLLSFSLITNFKAICDRNVGTDSIPPIHGLRAISMGWVILGHTCILAFKYSDNMEYRKEVEKEFMFQTISNGAFSVDTFFFISGFLVSFIYFRTNAKGKLEKLSKNVSEFTAGTFHFLGLVLYRFIRLTAPYMYTLGIVEVSMRYFAKNSVFDPPTQDHLTCPKYWWRNLLYINTLFPVDEMCMLWSWYLANDTQFYIIGAIILIVAVRHFKVAATTLVGFMISAWITTGIIAYNNNHMPNTDDPLALFDKIYDKPWTRLGPYLVGMTVGWILFKTNCKIKFTKLQLIAGWSMSTGTILYLLYGLYNQELSKVAAAAYSSLSHSAWAIALAWIIIACSTDNGGFVNKFLSAPALYPFSRVTYCAYLVHPIVIRAFVLNSDTPFHLGVESMIIIFFGQVASSYILAFAVSLAFEAPVVTMLRILRSITK
jgi:peptidoglycan/LPS O-acetylase OafA/YrhL